MTTSAEPDPLADRPRARGRRVPIIIAAGVVVILLVGGVLVWRAAATTTNVALASSPKPVTAVAAEAKSFQPEHTYVGALRPWIAAKIGPQYVAAYADTVLVRPGAAVKKGDVLATLDCRYPLAETATIASHARGLATRQAAMADEAERVRSLVDGGYVALNESEIVTAKSHAEADEVESQRSNLARSGLDVRDCTLRAPFDGEVSERLVDPGTFVQPSAEMLGVVDRTTVRMTADAPETDFDVVAPGTPVTVHVLSIDLDVPATISRRAPSADLRTRTVHFEVDIENHDLRIPVDTTGEVHVRVGRPIAAAAVPLEAATINEEMATIFTVERGIARKRVLAPLAVSGPDVVFPRDALEPGTLVVVEGRALLEDGERVAVKVEPRGGVAP